MSERLHQGTLSKLGRMNTWVLQLCVSLALFIRGCFLADIVFQPLPVQPQRASFPEGTTAMLPCRLEHGQIQDYQVFWFRQQPGDRPAHVLKHDTQDQIERIREFDERFVSIRNVSTNAYLLHIKRAHTEDSATYWCMAETNRFSTAVSGAGTQLSITGGKTAKEPTRVTLLSDAPAHISDSPDLHALCLAEHFYPGFVEFEWSVAGNTITEGVTPGQVILNDDGFYSATSILIIPRNLLGCDASLKCLVHHYSSGFMAERSLKLC